MKSAGVREKRSLGILFVCGALFLGGSHISADPSQQCRTYPASYRIVTKAAAVTSTTKGTCTFDASTVEGTCTNIYTDTAGTSVTTVSVTKHVSVGDVVDEISVIPPLNRALMTTTKITGKAGNSTGTSRFTYDSQKRLVSIESVSEPSRQTSKTVYTAWDRAGRPTAGTQGATPVTFSYDDSRRAQVMRSVGVECTQAFDENGNPKAGECPGSTTTTTVLSTAQVCR